MWCMIHYDYHYNNTIRIPLESPTRNRGRAPCGALPTLYLSALSRSPALAYSLTLKHLNSPTILSLCAAAWLAACFGGLSRLPFALVPRYSSSETSPWMVRGQPILSLNPTCSRQPLFCDWSACSNSKRSSGELLSLIHI